MKYTNLIQWITVGALTLTLTFFFSRSQISNLESHSKVEHTLRKVREQDALLKESVLKLRTGAQKNYDKLSSANREVGRLLKDLQADLSELGDNEELSRLARSYRYFHQARQLDIDGFKRKIALFHNSLYHFSRTANEYLETRRHNDAQGPKIQENLVSLVSLILASTTAGSSIHHKKADTLINELRQVSGVVNKKFTRLLRHAEIINDEVWNVNDITSRLSSNQGISFDKKIEQIHQELYQTQEATAQQYRLALYIISIVLIIVVIGILIRLSRARDKLVIANNALTDNTHELEKALEKQTELNDMQRQFVSMASHEFRTPLTIIDGTAQRLISRAEKNLTPADTIKRADKIRTAVRRMTQLMESTLSAARMQEGKISVEIGNCDIKSIIQQSCIHQQEVALSHEISYDLAALPDRIQADGSALEQIITNLLSNSVKYAPNAPSIQVSARCENNQVFIAVHDHGIGIDPEDLDKIGERFFRAKTSTGIAGTGIGLNLVQTLLDMHDGALAVTSTKGEGSTFTICLPISGPVIANAPIVDAA